MFQGPKGDKGVAARGGAVVVADSNGLPTGFIEGPPGPPGNNGLPGKKVCNRLKQICNSNRFTVVSETKLNTVADV